MRMCRGADVGNLVLVRDDDQRHAALLLNAPQNLHDVSRVRAVEVAGRLVGQQDRGIVGQGARNGHALPLSGGELVGIMAHAILEAHLLKQRRGALGAMVGAVIHRQHGHLHIFDGAQRGQQMKRLEDESHLARAIAVQIDSRSQRGSLEQEPRLWWAYRGRPADAAGWISRCRSAR